MEALAIDTKGGQRIASRGANTTRRGRWRKGVVPRHVKAARMDEKEKQGGENEVARAKRSVCCRI